MRHVKEILRQKWHLARAHREIARSVGLSVGAIGETLRRATKAGLEWAEVQKLDEGALEGRLYRHRPPRRTGRPLPDPAALHLELRKKGVTLQLLHVEYLEQHPDGYRYTQFCEIYKRWLARQAPTMRHVHRAGEKMFTDYSGARPSIVDAATGEVVEVELFVAVLGASNYTYAEATRTQQSVDWIESHIRALDFFEGAAAVWVPDQLKSGVTRACRYEPGVQRTYAELAEHYGSVVIPARPRTPRDKAKAEAGVLVAQRWILARLRHQTFFSLEALNERIAELLDELNRRTMKAYKASRRELFERLDRPALGALPPTRFVYGVWKVAKVSELDYHVEYEGHYYSVPHALVGEHVDVRVSARTVEVFYKGRRVASHTRSHRRGQHTTVPAHMPKSHRAHAEWTPARLIRWGNKVGVGTGALVTAIFHDRPHPEQGYRSCLGILRLEKRYGPARLEAACARALAAGARSYKHVATILKHGLDRLELAPPDSPPRAPIAHANVRGPDYYRQGESEC
jgi:transposase